LLQLVTPQLGSGIYLPEDETHYIATTIPTWQVPPMLAELAEREAVVQPSTLAPPLPSAATREERARSAYIIRARAANAAEDIAERQAAAHDMFRLPPMFDVAGRMSYSDALNLGMGPITREFAQRVAAERAQPTPAERPHWLLAPRREVFRGGASVVSDNGLNFIANLERNLYTISHSNGYITSIPTTYADVGWGRDFRVNPLPVGRPVPTSVNAAEALELMREDVEMIERAFIRDFGNGFFTQQQLDALVSLRFNTGALSNFDGLIDYLRTGNYDRDIMRTIFVNHYQSIVDEHPHNQRYFDGWMNRIERTLDLFFAGNYGNMPIDAITGRVNRN